jgi:eukaryotic-like serine/threonine-protein kinase
MAESVPLLAAGTVIGGNYEALHQIGRGGMGEVWAAKHTRLPKHVAIKVLHLRGAPLTDDALARFKREAEIACRLKHPNIVDVTDIGQLPSGDPFLVLELLEGEPLSRRLKRGPMPLDEVRSVVRQVGSALQAAHYQGVVHRDLKPDNIFLLPSPLGGLRVKVLDFGISKIQDSSTVQTQEAVLVGTPQYMSPEQATGSNKDVGPQADVFALGSIVYEMLTGTAAFTGESIAQLVFRVAYEKHTPLAGKVGADVPATAVAAVERALLKDRAQRTADIATFVVEFTGEAITLTPTNNLAPAPQMAVVATPSMELSASLAMGDTAAPGSQPAARLPTPAIPTGPATPQVPTAPASVPPSAAVAPASSSSQTSGSAAQYTSTSSTGPRRFSLAWVSSGAAVAAMALIAVGLTVRQRPEPLADVTAADEAIPQAAVESAEGPRAVASGGSAKPPEPVAPPPVEQVAVNPVSPPVPLDEEPMKVDPKPTPKVPPSAETNVRSVEPVTAESPREMLIQKIHKREEITPQEDACIRDLQSAGAIKGTQKPDLRALRRLWEKCTEGVVGQRAMDQMTAEVARAMCASKEEWHSWRDRIKTPAVRRDVNRDCR